MEYVSGCGIPQNLLYSLLHFGGNRQNDFFRLLLKSYNMTAGHVSVYCVVVKAAFLFCR